MRMSEGDYWWGRGDLNPGPRTPQARILDHTRPRPQQLDYGEATVKGNIVNILLGFKNLGKTGSSVETMSHARAHKLVE